MHNPDDRILIRIISIGNLGNLAAQDIATRFDRLVVTAAVTPGEVP
jgi:hypothetical protein